MTSFRTALAFLGLSASAFAQQASRTPAESVDLTTMSIEDLMSVQVTSASKKAENLSTAPAAVYVITGEDLRRGGFTSVPDALRMVPGLYVVQQNSHIWLISARGFSNEFNDKMLVLIDGRLVYSPTFGGVYWDVQDPPLEDIERIEIIRGPGGTLWGANAVNGVINIITKSARQTQGALAESSAGINEGYSARVRYGGAFGEHVKYRVFGTSNEWLPTTNATGTANYDDWSISQGGMRLDWDATQADRITFDGAGYSGRIRDLVTVFSPTSASAELENASGVVKGGHVLGRWSHSFRGGSGLDILGYCDWTDRFGGGAQETRNTCDLELQHRYAINPRHTLTWGGSILTTGDYWAATFSLSILPPFRRDTTYSALAQYDLVLVPDRVRLIAGSKFDHNPYTGFEYQPQVRAVWTPNSQHTFWTAASRAVRTPNRIDSGLSDRIMQINPVPPPIEFLLYSGDGSLKSEVVKAYEAGYRHAWRQAFSVDAAAFYNDYDKLASLSPPGAPVIHATPFFVDLPVFVVNGKGGHTHGWRFLRGSRLSEGGNSPRQSPNFAAALLPVRAIRRWRTIRDTKPMFSRDSMPAAFSCWMPPTTTTTQSRAYCRQ